MGKFSKEKTELRSAKRADVDQTTPQQDASLANVKEFKIIPDKDGEVEKTKDKDVANMSKNGKTGLDNEKYNLLPRKPVRLLTFTGNKEDDSKHSQSVNCSHLNDNKQSLPSTDTASKTIEEKKNSLSDEKKNVCQSYRRHFYDDDHPYEDPNVFICNAEKPLAKKQNHSKEYNDARGKQKKMNEPPTSPVSIKSGISKSTESIKAAVKGLKESHASIMADTSTARSIFACLVALLLALIVFLALYFLLYCHGLLAVAIAIVVHITVFLYLGFLNGKRIKCLVLLTLPSVCSRGGRFALYVLLGYFVITGPFCNTVKNLKIVRNTMKCMEQEQEVVASRLTRRFKVAQKCLWNVEGSIVSLNKTFPYVSCLVERCIKIKSKFIHMCDSDKYALSPKFCKASEGLSCFNGTFIYEGRCQGTSVYCIHEFNELSKLLNDISSNDSECSFLEIFSLMFPLLILLVFYEGYRYEIKYRTFNNFNNFFLTGHFQLIDQRRASCDREAVLPLRKVELRRHVRPQTLCNITEEEKSSLYKMLQTFFIVLLLVLFLTISDLYVYRIFNNENHEFVPRENSTQPTSEWLDLNAFDVNATDIGNSTIQKTNTTSVLMKTSSNKKHDACWAEVKAPGLTSKVFLPLVISLLLFLILFDGYVSRLRWYICSRIYPQREKERAFYLYNRILEDRVQLVEQCRKRMKSYHREMNSLKSLEVTRILSKQSPWFSKFLEKCHFNLRRCVVCRDWEKPEFKICHGLDCLGIYCLTCYFDVDKKCLYCDTELKYSLSQKLASERQHLSSKESLV